jgi:hypothetical protein
VKVILSADGTTDPGTPLVMHNERLVDPLDEFVQEIATHTGKRGNNKTLSTHANISRLEFYGGLYTEPPLTLSFVEGRTNGASPRVCVPANNIIRCLQQAGSQFDKKGQHVLRGIHQLEEYALLEYDGPDDPIELYKDPERFLLRKSVGVQRSRTMRSRPLFADWKLSLPIEVDQVVFNLETVRNIWAYAGRYVGLGEMRPIYGRFVGEVQDAKAAEKKAAKR